MFIDGYIWIGFLIGNYVDYALSFVWLTTIHNYALLFEENGFTLRWIRDFKIFFCFFKKGAWWEALVLLVWFTIVCPSVFK